MLTTHFTHASILGLNAMLVESPSLLIEHFAVETPEVICQGIANKDVRRWLSLFFLLYSLRLARRAVSASS